MKKRIYRNMMFLAVASLLLLTCLNSMVSYYSLTSTVKEELKESVQFAQGVLGSQQITSGNIGELNLNQPNFRFTIIDPHGKVLYDSLVKAETLDNHGNREEIQKAYEKGFGETRRFSSTLGTETYYYAVKLTDGSVLRTSKTVDSIVGIFARQLPYLALIIMIVLLFGNYVALRLSRKIVEPINAFDFEKHPIIEYDEMAPLMRTMERQQSQISEYIADLEQKAQTIHLIMDTMREGIILLDGKGLIVSINKSALSLFDGPDPVEGKNILELSRNQELLENVQLTFHGQSRDMKYEVNQKIYHVFFSPATENGAIILFLDITDIAKTEEIRREFSANVSHELKTPLTSISGYAEMIHSGMAQEKDVHGFAGKIKEEATRLIHLIEDIIMISELDEKVRIRPKEEVEIDAVAREVFDSLEMKAKERQVSLELQGKLNLKANQRMMFEVLYNLVDNGIQYNREGGQVRVRLFEDQEFSHIFVEDTGIGIPEEHKDRIFERFYRADSSRSKKTGGTGLGLSIVKHIVQIYQGEILLSSSKSGGTIVEIIIPKL